MESPGRSVGRDRPLPSADADADANAEGNVDAEGNAAQVPGVDSVSAVTLATHDMARALRFYRALGFALHHGGEDSSFSCLRAGSAHLNLIAEGTEGRTWSWWGRLIFHVPNVDAFHRHVLAQGLVPEFAPRDAVWRERYFHITDPDGHELSFVHPVPGPSSPG